MPSERGAAFVTGGGRGVGAGIARALAYDGWPVIVGARSRDQITAVANEIGGRAVEVDVSNRESVEQAFAEAGDVELLVANAGIGNQDGSTWDVDPDDWWRVLEVNVLGVHLCCRAVIPGMLERGSGNLVYIGSISGKVPAGGASVYSASKFGLRGFAFSLHEELRESGVGVTTVFPGFIRDAGLFADTGLKLPRGAGTRTPEQVADAVLTGIATNRPEITVAALSQRVGGLLSGAAPRLVAAIVRASGGERLADDLGDAQRKKR